MEGGGGKEKIRGAICINKLLKEGAIKFFQENEGVAIKWSPRPNGNLILVLYVKIFLF